MFLLVIFTYILFLICRSVITEVDRTSSKPIAPAKVKVKPVSVSKKKVDNLPQGRRSDWNLQLVNADIAISSEEVILGRVQGEFFVDERIVAAVENLLNGAAQAGITLEIISAYRSITEQENILNNLAQEIGSKECKSVAEKGHSEHHLGLAIDVIDANCRGIALSSELSNSPGGIWLRENAPNFGFIMRYPENKEKITKIIFEPWHYRFVGVEAAVFMKENGLTLEELHDKLKEAGR